MSFNLNAAIETQQQIVIELQSKGIDGDMARLAQAIEGLRNLELMRGRPTAEASAPNTPNYLVRSAPDHPPATPRHLRTDAM